MSAALFNLLLAVLGLPVVVLVVVLVARHFVYRHADQQGPAVRAAGHLQVANAETAARKRAAEAAQMDAAHHHTAGWVGVPGECGVECACGLTYDGFDTIAEAAALLDNHIARETGRRPKELIR